jgi:hypothetical protein
MTDPKHWGQFAAEIREQARSARSTEAQDALISVATAADRVADKIKTETEGTGHAG